MKRSPVFYGQAIVDGALRFVRRWLADGPTEVISDEQLHREHEERVAGLEAAKAALLRKNPRATPEQIRDELIAYEQRVAAKWPPEGPPVALPIDHSDLRNPFVAMKCVRCGAAYETREPTVRKVCEACTGLLTVPKPDPKPAAAFRPAPVAPIPRPVGRPSEAGPDSNPSRGDQMSHYAPEVGSKSAAGVTRPEMTKSIVPDSFSGNAGSPGLAAGDEHPLLRDPEYQKARAAGDTAEMARIAAEFGRKQRSEQRR